MVEIEGYNLPDELYYTKDHTWARVEDDGKITVGMDAYGAKAAGNIEFIDLPMEDDEFEIGEAFGSLESAKWVGGLLMPVGGTVIAVHDDIEDESQHEIMDWLKAKIDSIERGDSHNAEEMPVSPSGFLE